MDSIDKRIEVEAESPIAERIEIEQPLAREFTTADSDAKSTRWRNFSLIAAFQITMRTGWIFKTESIIIPAVLDLLGGSGALRGFLPMLNRFGQSLPPIIAADFVQARPQKKTILAAMSAVMGTCFLVLALIWWLIDGQPVWWAAYAFLLIYAVFFSSVGINNLSLGTITGKLVRVRRRGRLILVANSIGAVIAVLFAWFLLTLWLGDQTGNFFAIFAFAGSCFFLGAIIILCLDERRDPRRPVSFNLIQPLREMRQVLVRDRQFRLVAVCAAFFGMSMTLFPHYQALARINLNLSLQYLIPWVIVQNLAVGIISLPVGWVADRFGYRAVLRFVLLGLAAVPIVALTLSHMGGFGANAYFLVFALLGLTPVTFRIFNNFTLEFTHQHNHARYLSVVAASIAGPAIVASPILGWLIDIVGFVAVFVIVSACVGCGWLLTFLVVEPRNRRQSGDRGGS